MCVYYVARGRSGLDENAVSTQLSSLPCLQLDSLCCSTVTFCHCTALGGNLTFSCSFQTSRPPLQTRQ